MATAEELKKELFYKPQHAGAVVEEGEISNADAFAAVLAVNAFKLQDAHRHCLLQPSLGRTY